jgi:hypothetical protein
MDMGVQPGHGYATGTWICSMDIVMQNGQGHAARTWICSMNMVIVMDMDMGKTWTLTNTEPALTADNSLYSEGSAEKAEVSESAFKAS